MREEIDLDGYLVCFPVYIIANEGFANLVYGTSNTGKISLSIFTDEDAATTFNEREMGDQLIVQRFDILRLLGLLAIIEAMGMSHVTIDPYRSEGECRNSSIELLRTKLITFFQAV